jgi:hypothetical protein
LVQVEEDETEPGERARCKRERRQENSVVRRVYARYQVQFVYCNTYLIALLSTVFAQKEIRDFVETHAALKVYYLFRGSFCSRLTDVRLDLTIEIKRG